MSERAARILKSVLGIVFPLIATYVANRAVSAKIHALEVSEEDAADYKEHPSFEYLSRLTGVDALQRKYEESLDHKQQLEDKAKALVALATISTSIMFGLSSAMSGIFTRISLPAVRWVLAAMMIFSAFYMVAAAFCSIGILASLNKVFLADDDGTDESIKVTIMQNEYQNIMRSNHLYSSFDCVRRSLGSLLLIFIVTVVAA